MTQFRFLPFSRSLQRLETEQSLLMITTHFDDNLTLLHGYLKMSLAATVS